jgi:hypothetical protein
MFRKKTNNNFKIKTIILLAGIIFSLSVATESAKNRCSGVGGKTGCNNHYNSVNTEKYFTILKTCCHGSSPLCDLRNNSENAGAILKTNSFKYKVNKQDPHVLALVKQGSDLQFKRAGPLFFTYKSIITCPIYLINQSFRC